MDIELDEVIASVRNFEASGRFDLAADLWQTLFEEHPQNDGILGSYVDASLRLGQAERALVACNRAIAMSTMSSYALRQRAFIYFSHFNDLAAAVKSLKERLHAYPSDAELHLLIADLSFQTLDFDAARTHGLKAAEIGDPHTALRARHLFLEDHEGAVDVARSILAVRPDDMDALTQCGISLYMLGRFEESASYLYRAAEHEPYRGDVIFPLAGLLLLLGDTKAGWRRYEAFAEAGFLKHGPPVLTDYHDRLWRGQPLGNRRILVINYLGLGDSLMFARYARNLKEAGAHVTLYVKPELMRLMQGLEGADELLGAWPLETWGDYDYWIFDNLLPARFGASEGKVPAWPEGYIKLTPQYGAKALTIPDRSADRLRIGLCWSTVPTHFTRRARILAPEDLQPLAQMSDVDWFILQKRPLEPDFAARSGLSIVDFSHEWDDFHDSAAFASTLDLTISIDSAPVHLAGALGLPAWVMISDPPEWRWGRQGEYGAWYPHIRIFRQKTRGDWRSVTHTVRVALESERIHLRRS